MPGWMNQIQMLRALAFGLATLVIAALAQGVVVNYMHSVATATERLEITQAAQTEGMGLHMTDHGHVTALVTLDPSRAAILPDGRRLAVPFTGTDGPDTTTGLALFDPYTRGYEDPPAALNALVGGPAGPLVRIHGAVLNIAEHDTGETFPEVTRAAEPLLVALHPPAVAPPRPLLQRNLPLWAIALMALCALGAAIRAANLPERVGKAVTQPAPRTPREIRALMRFDPVEPQESLTSPELPKTRRRAARDA